MNADSDNDKRISFFRLAERSYEEVGVFKVEYEVEADSLIVGEGRYKQVLIRPWTLNRPRDGTNLVYVEMPGRTYGSPDQGLPDPREELRHGFHSGLEAAGELLALASVFCRRRLTLRAVTKSDGRPLRSEYAGRLYPELRGEGADFSQIGSFLKSIEALEPDDQAAVLIASKFYQHGLRLTDYDPEIAYLMHIFSIESLAQREKSEMDPEEVLPADWVEMLALIPDPEPREKLKRQLADTQKARWAFKTFVEKRTSPEFYRVTDSDSWLNEGNIVQLAANAYDARSDLAHTGSPFKDDVLFSSADREEIAYGFPALRGDGPNPLSNKEIKKRRLPQLHAFERLTRHLILQFVEYHSQTSR